MKINWKKAYTATLLTIGVTTFGLGATSVVTEEYNQIAGKNRTANVCEVKAKTGQGCTPGETRELAEARDRAMRQAGGFVDMMLGSMLLEAARRRGNSPDA